MIAKPHPPAPIAYSRAERLSDGAIHVTGVGLGLVGAAVLLTLTLLQNADTAVLVANAVYCAVLLAMLGASAAYHMAPQGAWKDPLRRLDQSAIYLKIAGTYTPFLIFAGMSQGPLMAGLWAAALLGVALKLFAPQRFVTLALLLYLGMGWVGLTAGDTLLGQLNPDVVSLILFGGIIYTAGVVFYLWESLPFHNTIWHGFVLIATGVFYSAVLLELTTAAVI